MLNIKCKKLHPQAKIPTYAKPGDAGMDLYCVSVQYDQLHDLFVYDTGIAFEIPVGYVGLVFPRSSICDTNLNLRNCVGVIDPGYRGSVKCKFKKDGNHAAGYQPGDRCAQMVILPIAYANLIEVDELSESERGTGGYGHTGR